MKLVFHSCPKTPSDIWSNVRCDTQKFSFHQLNRPYYYCISGGLIQLNHGRPQPLQYVVNAAFLASLYGDYLEAADTPGWYCGPHFYPIETLRNFARTQVGLQSLKCWNLVIPAVFNS